MKNLVMFLTFCFMVSAVSAQNLWVKNDTDEEIEVYGLYAVDDGTCDVTPTPIAGCILAPGESCQEPIPPGMEVYKLGAVSGGTASGGTGPCWSVDCGFVPGLTFTWVGCFRVFITP